MLARYGSTEFRNLFINDVNNLCLYSSLSDEKLLGKFRKVYFESSKQDRLSCGMELF